MKNFLHHLPSVIPVDRYGVRGRGVSLAGPALTVLLVATTAAGQPVPAGHQSAMSRPAPAGTISTTRPGNLKSMVSFNFQSAPVDAVLDYLSQAYGFIVLKTDHIHAHVTITSKQPVSADDAVNALDSVLKPLNYTIIRTDRVLRIVATDQAKKADVPVHFGADPANIADTDQIITQVIPVQSVDATKLRTDLAPLLSASADVTANAGSNSIIITDTSANIRRIVKIVADVDQHRTEVSDLRVYHLKYADATSTATLINSIFNPPNTNQQTGPQSPFFGRFRRGGQNSQQQTQPGAGGNEIGGKVNASGDERTNSLVVTGPTDELTIVDRVVTQIDSNPAANQAFFIYSLKNGDASNIQYVLNTLFGNPASPPQNTTGITNSFGSTSSSNSSFGARGNTGGSTSFGGSSLGGSSFGGTSTANRGTTSTGTTANRTGGTGSTTTATNALAGQAYFVADESTNSLLVTTNQKYATQVKDMIQQLDEPVPQVLIQALVAEVTLDNSTTIGTEFSVFNQRTRLNATGQVSGNIAPDGSVSGATGTANVTQYGSNGGSALGIASAIASAAASGSPSGMVAQVVENNFSATLQALAQENKLDVLSRPYILASDNQEATMMVGQEVPIITNSTITTEGTVVNTPSYQQVGVILDVTPHINSDGIVTMDVTPQVSQIEAGTGVTISPGVTAPIFGIQQAQSIVAVKDGQTVVIGGLMQNQNTKTVSKIPLLGDIPWIGPLLFSHTVTDKTKTELLIFLTPHVVRRPALLNGMAQRMEHNLQLVPKAVGPGVFQQQMKGMQVGATTRPATTQPTENPLHEFALPH